MLRKHAILLAPAPAATAPPAGGGTATPAAPSPSPSPAAADSGGDDFGAVDAMTKPKAAAAPAKPAAQPKPGEPAKPDANEPAWDDPDDNKFKTPKQLRDARKRALQTVQEYSAKIKDAEKRLADADRRGQDTSVLTKRLEALEKEKNDLQASLRAAKQEVSPEFKQKYDAPLERAIGNIQRLVTELNTVDAEGNAIGKGTPGDFTRIYGMKYGDAKAESKRLFGEEAGVVMDSWREIHRLSDDRAEALKGEQENWQKRQEQEKANEISIREGWQTAVDTASKQIVEKHSDLFADGADAEENGVRKAAYSVIDNWVQGKDNAGNPLTPQKMAHATAMIRHRAASHPVMMYRLNKAEARITELEGKLKELNGGDPGDTRRSGGGDTTITEGEPGGVKALSADLRKALAG